MVLWHETDHWVEGNGHYRRHDTCFAHVYGENKDMKNERALRVGS